MDMRMEAISLRRSQQGVTGSEQMKLCFELLLSSGDTKAPGRELCSEQPATDQ
jgi:hypothetical protein